MDNDNHTDLQRHLHRSVIEQVSSLSVRSHQKIAKTMRKTLEKCLL
jgi:hypothetical protein